MYARMMLLNTGTGGVVELSAGLWTCDLSVAGSSPALAPLRSGLGQATYTCVPLSPSSTTWYWPKRGCLATGEYRQKVWPVCGCAPLVTHRQRLTSIVAFLCDSLLGLSVLSCVTACWMSSLS